MSNTHNLTLRQNAFGFYYSHSEEFNAVGELINEKIVELEKNFAEAIMRDAELDDENIDFYHKQKYLYPNAPFNS